MGIELLNELEVMKYQEELVFSEMKNNSVNSVFISGNVASSKNSKRIVFNRGMKYPMLINSETVMNYKKIAIPQFETKKDLFLDIIQGKQFPLKIELKFIRDTKRLFDFINAAQVIFDLMVECDWIEDDNYKFVVPYFNPEVIIDKAKCGVEIKILN